jgi:hypothetical protein
MRSTIARLLLLAPVLALLVACPRPDRTVIAKGSRDAYVTVEAQLDANGTPKFGEYHDTELVRPGDTLEFRCKCDPGLEFKVSPPRLVVNKDAFFDLLLQGDPGTARKHVEAALASLGGQVAANPVDDAHKLEVEAPKSVGGPQGPPPPGLPDPDAVAFLRRFLQDFQKVIPEHPTAQLFGDWRDPDFHRGDAAIGPFEVAKMDPGQDFASTWKFTWTIRAAGEQDPSKWVVLDPHVEWEPFHKDY